MKFHQLMATFLAAVGHMKWVPPPATTGTRHYAAAKGNTNALKIRRAAAKVRNVQQHRRNCKNA